PLVDLHGPAHDVEQGALVLNDPDAAVGVDGGVVPGGDHLPGLVPARRDVGVGTGKNGQGGLARRLSPLRVGPRHVADEGAPGRLAPSPVTSSYCPGIRAARRRPRTARGQARPAAQGGSPPGAVGQGGPHGMLASGTGGEYDASSACWLSWAPRVAGGAGDGS